MSLFSIAAEVVGYRSPAERQAQREARSRVVQVKPEMASLTESRVTRSFIIRAVVDLGFAVFWFVLACALLWASVLDIHQALQGLAIIGMILAIPMMAGRLITAIVQGLRAVFMRFDWIAFEDLMSQAAGHPIN